MPGAIGYAEMMGSYRGQVFVVKHFGRTARMRTGFYYSGLGIGLALDMLRPGWRDRYFERHMWLTDLLAGHDSPQVFPPEQPEVE